MHYVYLIQSQKDRSTYIGCTADLIKRIQEHNQGKTKSIKHKIPYTLIYYESFLHKTDATKREYELKHNSCRKENLLKRLINSLAPSSSG